VRCDDGGDCLAHLAGRMRVNRIRIIPGDRVIVELPDPSAQRGRIIYRK
jgi:translation initiation factor IF-1